MKSNLKFVPNNQIVAFLKQMTEDNQTSFNIVLKYWLRINWNVIL